MNNTVCGIFLCKLVCEDLAEFLCNFTELFQFVVQNFTDGNSKRIQRGDQSICYYYLCILRPFVKNTVCGVFLCQLVCGNLAEFLYNFAELFRFVVHNSFDVNGKKIQSSDQWPHKTTSLFKKHLLLTRFLGYFGLKWFRETEVRFCPPLWKISGLWKKVR